MTRYTLHKRYTRRSGHKKEAIHEWLCFWPVDNNGMQFVKVYESTSTYTNPHEFEQSIKQQLEHVLPKEVESQDDMTFIRTVDQARGSWDDYIYDGYKRVE